MKLSISNIAWDKSFDEEMYGFLSQNGFKGLEIAPTRIWMENPYGQLTSAKEFRKKMKEEYGLEISSIQSIWYGRSEKIFGGDAERNSLIEYTKRALEFANVLACKNLVFGCPRNRAVPEGMEQKAINSIADEFFSKLSDFAKQNGTILAMEANPPIYNTNYINFTREAYDLVKRIDASGFGLNYDFGTVIFNEENVEDINTYFSVINHIHISEPKLAEVQFRELHVLLKNILQQNNYGKFVSIEMGNFNNVEMVKSICIALKNLFTE